jgi:hypothetical protein
MSLGTRLTRLEAAATLTDGTDADLCPDCGGLNIETLMQWADEAEAEGGHSIESDRNADEPADVAEMREARCRRCGAPTLTAWLAGYRE